MCMLFSSYSYGNADFQRHTNETLTYKMACNMQFEVPRVHLNSIGKYNVYGWIVYDKSPTGSMPTCSSIFDTFYDTRPVTWTVSRDVCHRFVVKKKFKVQMSSNGKADARAQTSQGMGTPCNDIVDVVKFFNKLGVRTEWKNNTTGEIGDIKSGGLYLCLASSCGYTCNVYGRFRVYFKSVGNQ
ncbi:hypothetical protein DITRI_Ditri07aG0166400 [Diplodiscus trichospermus]